MKMNEISIFSQLEDNILYSLSKNGDNNLSKGSSEFLEISRARKREKK